MTAPDSSLKQDPRYSEALRHFQSGNWHEAIEALMDLEGVYPDQPEVQSLLEQARLKAGLEEDWGERIKTRRVPVAARKIAVRVALVLLVIAAIFGAVNLYRRVYLPRKALMTVQAQGVELREQAQQAQARGDYQLAKDSWSDLLQITPDDAEAKAGLAEAERQIQLVVDYEAAMTDLAGGDVESARARLLDIEARFPGYRDVARQLEGLDRSERPRELFAQAEQHYAAGRWQEAIKAYEALREENASYEKGVVEAHLFDSHLALGQSFVSEWPENDQAAVLQAQQSFRQALSLRPQEERATEEQDLTYVYVNALEFLDAGDWQEGVALLRSIYEQRPDYMGGQATERLYRAYLSLGDSYLAAGDAEEAGIIYERAARLEMDDVSEALVRISGLIPGLTPTATPTPSPTPTPTLTSTPTVGPTPLPTPRPTPMPIWYYAGWVAFLSDRDGGGLFVMRSDGSSVAQMDSMDLLVYEQLLEAQRRSPDGKSRVYAESEGGSSEPTDLYVFRDDLPPDWLRRRVLVDHGKHCYDPAWSPDGEKVVFVSQVTANDEIWVVDADGSDDEQLTSNDWEWDKQPTWSPDGSQIAFWSNRVSGRKQIWVMNADGTDQHNISNNEYNDWGPLWISPALVDRVAEAVEAAKTEKAEVRATLEVLQRESAPPTATPTSTPTATPTSPPVPTDTPVPTVEPTPTEEVAAVADPWEAGRVAFRSDRSGDVGIYTMDPEGGDVQQVSDEARYRQLLQSDGLSPDGTQRLIVLNTDQNLDIYAVAEGEAQRRLTSNSRADYDPAWSPDGRTIAFTSERYDGGDIFLMEADGDNDVRLTSETAGTDRRPSWSPDGRQIVFWSDRVVGRKQIWVMNSDGSGQRNISGNPYNDWDPVWIK